MTETKKATIYFVDDTNITVEYTRREDIMEKGVIQLWNGDDEAHSFMSDKVFYIHWEKIQPPLTFNTLEEAKAWCDAAYSAILFKITDRVGLIYEDDGIYTPFLNEFSVYEKLDADYIKHYGKTESDWLSDAELG